MAAFGGHVRGMMAYTYIAEEITAPDAPRVTEPDIIEMRREQVSEDIEEN